MSSLKPPTIYRIYFLDGLRGLGAVIVALCHIGQDYGISNYIYTRYDPLYFFFDGPFAVFLFFVISGYALTSVTLRKLNQFDFRSMVFMRTLRLCIPVAMSLAIAFLLHATGFLHGPINNTPVWTEGFYNFPVSPLEFLKEALGGNVIFRLRQYNVILWSMQPEFLCSMVLYVLTLIYIKTNFSITYWSYLFFAALMVLFFFVDRYFLCFFSGSIFYILNENNPKMLNLAFLKRMRRHISCHAGQTSFANMKRTVSAVFFVVILYVISSQMLVNLLDEYGHVVRALLLFSIVHFLAPLRTLFSNRFFQFLGKISFPLYLVHFPILCALSAPSYRYLSSLHVVHPEYYIFGLIFSLSVFSAIAFESAEHRIRTRIAASMRTFAIR